MGTNALSLEVCASPECAPDYKQQGGWKAATLKKAVVVRNGTLAGNATIDLQFTDDQGNRYVAMITAALLRQLVVVAGDGEG